MDAWIDLRHGGSWETGYVWRYDVIDARGKVLAHGERARMEDARSAARRYIATCGYVDRGEWSKRKVEA